MYINYNFKYDQIFVIGKISTNNNLEKFINKKNFGSQKNFSLNMSPAVKGFGFGFMALGLFFAAQGLIITGSTA